MALAYKVLDYPHLSMALELGAVYTKAELELRCGGTPERREKLAAKLKNRQLFQPASLKDALSRKRKTVEGQPKWVRPPQVRAGRKVDEDAGRRRRIAERLASQLLTRGGAVSDEDVLLILKTWATRENKARKNVKRLGRRVFSDTFGMVKSRGGRQPVLTQLSKKCPCITRILTGWLRGKDANFPCTSISLNVNYAAARHRDKNNWGPSCIHAFGHFKGGLLRYWPRDSRTEKLNSLRKADSKLLDVKTKLHYFDGTRAHEVAGFRGERFSLVFFSVGAHALAPKHLKTRCRKLGFQLPTAAKMSRALALV